MWISHQFIQADNIDFDDGFVEILSNLQQLIAEYVLKCIVRN